MTKLLTIEEVAKILRVRRPHAYALARNGTIPTVHIGRLIRVDSGQLEKFIQNGGKALSGGWRKKKDEEEEIKFDD
jgi:excisionase family DNA binding protein